MKSRRSQVEQAEADRQLQREAIAEVIAAGRTYERDARAVSLLIMGLKGDMIAVAQNPQVDKTGQSLAALTLALARAELLVADQQLREVLDQHVGPRLAAIPRAQVKMHGDGRSLPSDEAIVGAEIAVDQLERALQELAQRGRSELVQRGADR